MRHESLQNTGPTCLDIETCEPLEHTTSLALTLSQAASPVRTSPTQESEPESTERDRDYGANTPASFASYDPDTCSWRTSQHSFIEDLTVYSETWPRAGTMRNGNVYQQPPLVRLTDVIASSLWPTPNTEGYRSDGELRLLSKMCDPSEFKGMAHRAAQSKLKRYWPTPRAADWKGATPKTDTTAHRVSSGQANLPEVIQEATPNGGKLNPQWVEWLMGFPEGWTDLEDSETP